jgi:hypothetical protein
MRGWGNRSAPRKIFGARPDANVNADDGATRVSPIGLSKVSANQRLIETIGPLSAIDTSQAGVAIVQHFRHLVRNERMTAL